MIHSWTAALTRPTSSIILAIGVVACVPTSKEPANPPPQYEINQDNGSGGRVGNGGGGILCSEGSSIKSIELFDFFESSAGPRQWIISVDYQADLAKSKLEQAIETAQHVIDTRWRPIDSVMADYLTEKLKEFPQEVDWQTNSLRSLPDLENTITPPSGCGHVQLAIQTTPIFPGDKRYTIRKDFFEHEKFSNTSRAGLILHELIYRLTSLAGAKDSRSTRLLTSIFFSGNQKELTGDEGSTQNYFEYLKLAQMPWAGANGVAIRLDKPFRFETNNNLLMSGSAIAGWWTETPLGRQQIACQVGFAVDRTIREFSIGNPTGFIGDIKMTGFENVTLLGKVWSSEVRSTNWEKRYLADECEEQSTTPDYSVLKKTDGSKRETFNTITPCITASAQNQFYHVNACVNQNVAIWTVGPNTSVSGFTDVMSENILTFATGESCNSVTWVGHDGAKLDACTSRVFQDRLLSLDGDMKISTNKLSVTLDKRIEQKLTHKTHSKTQTIHAKPGSQITFDHEGQILQLTIHQVETLCIFPDTKSKRSFAAGLTLTFDSQSGCVEEAY